MPKPQESSKSLLPLGLGAKPPRAVGNYSGQEQTVGNVRYLQLLRVETHRPGAIFTRGELTKSDLDQIELWIAITENRFRPAESKIIRELQKATGLNSQQIKLTFPPPDGTVGEIEFRP